MNRARAAGLLLLTGPLLALSIYLLSARSPTSLLYGVLTPIVPFVVLALAMRMRRRDGTWRFRERDVYTLGVVIAALILVPYLWWWIERGSANISLGCFVGVFPILLPFILILGLGLAAESGTPQR